MKKNFVGIFFLDLFLFFFGSKKIFDVE